MDLRNKVGGDKGRVRHEGEVLVWDEGGVKGPRVTMKEVVVTSHEGGWRWHDQREGDGHEGGGGAATRRRLERRAVAELRRDRGGIVELVRKVMVLQIHHGLWIRMKDFHNEYVFNKG